MSVVEVDSHNPASIVFTNGENPFAGDRSWMFADPFLVRDFLFIVFGAFPVFLFLYIGESWVVILSDLCEFSFQAYAINHIAQYGISIAIVLRSAQKLFKCFLDHFPHDHVITCVKFTDAWIHERRMILMRHVFAWEVLRPAFQFHALVCLFNLYNFARRVAANSMTASIVFTNGADLSIVVPISNIFFLFRSLFSFQSRELISHTIWTRKSPLPAAVDK